MATYLCAVVVESQWEVVGWEVCQEEWSQRRGREERVVVPGMVVMQP